MLQLQMDPSRTSSLASGCEGESPLNVGITQSICARRMAIVMTVISSMSLMMMREVRQLTLDWTTRGWLDDETTSDDDDGEGDLMPTI